jgi:mono/diheme cytochrome c family protein
MGLITMTYRRAFVTAWFACLAGAAGIGFAQEEDEDFSPGLLAKYVAGNKAIERIDPNVQFVWNADSPDTRLPAGPFEATWTGQLLVKMEGKHTFHLYLAGDATVLLNGRPVVAGKRDTPGWVSGSEMVLDFGERKLEVRYRKTQASGAIKLLWSSEHFPLEPVPPQILFRESPSPQLNLVRRGQELFDGLRCNRCHLQEHDVPSPVAPALTDLRGGIASEWLVEWIQSPHKAAAQARMPAFGFTADEARSAAVFLLSNARSHKPANVPEVEREKTARAGEVLFRSVGCLACHTHGDLGTNNLFGGGDLTNIGTKRPVGWLVRWLKEPGELNPDHAMPVFKLTDEERTELALFLAGKESAKAGTEEGKSAEKNVIETGKKLVEAARCAACHRIDQESGASNSKAEISDLKSQISDLKSQIAGIPTLQQPVRDWQKACVRDAAEGGASRSGLASHQPEYRLAADDVNALKAFIVSRQGGLSPEGSFAFGRRLLQQKNCLSCHERDGGTGIAAVAGKVSQLDPDLQGQSQGMIPPDLTAVGDKLKDDALAKAVSGEQEKLRMPWLRVRMPRFVHAPEEKTALVNYLIGHDRIPEGAPRREVIAELSNGNAKQKGDLQKAGQALAGARGFSCVACHKVGKLEPRNVALATRGSDLYLMAERMRPEFFLRWVRSPLRIVPGMEMPSFERPQPGILDGNLDHQLAALWEALNDKKAAPKLDTSTVEQAFVVRAGEPARIIRDVFNIGDAVKPEFVSRALAIGFNNGSNLLFDLDEMSIRHVWTGDMARQRASGKSWYWEPAGVPLKEGAWHSGLVLKDGGDVLKPHRRAGRVARLVKYHSHDQGLAPPQGGHAVVLQYVLEFESKKGVIPISVMETITPWTFSKQNPDVVWLREISVHGVPEGYHVEAVMRCTESNPTEPRELFSQTERLQSKRSHGNTVDSFHSATILFRPEGVAIPTPPPAAVAEPTVKPEIETVTTVPGFDGVRLPLPRSIMPTSITWKADRTLAFCSLKGHVYVAKDTDGDGIEDQLILVEEGLASPYGIINEGNDLIVAHKPELLRLRDNYGDGRADVREVVADGWGYTDDYHDWTTGIVRDSQGNMYVGLGSDYANKGRSADRSKWRGKVLKISKSGTVTPVGSAFRYPTGLAINADDQIFVSDNQGVQNCFNEINHLQQGAWYGVPSLYEEPHADEPRRAAIQVPHPWTRSVNGLLFLPTGSTAHPFAGHGIGCEYDTRFLVRFTMQRVGDTYQGAIYPFSEPTAKEPTEGFLGTLCGGVAPNGDIYIGSIHDSGWLGGPNVGDIVRLRPNGKVPLGIREIRAYEGEFEISFTAPIDRSAAANPENYEVSAYTRKWGGAYATPDSNRHKVEVKSVDVAADGLSVVLRTGRQEAGYVYDISLSRIGPNGAPLWPTIGHYTMNVVPNRE